MAKYRKRPVVIEAFQYDENLRGKDGKWYASERTIKAFEDGVTYYDNMDCDSPPVELFIRTLESVHHASMGDYIVQDADGGLYPRKPGRFEKTYDKTPPLSPLLK